MTIKTVNVEANEWTCDVCGFTTLQIGNGTPHRWSKSDWGVACDTCDGAIRNILTYLRKTDFALGKELSPRLNVLEAVRYALTRSKEQQ